MSLLLSEGANCQMDALDLVSRQGDLAEALEFGNHKGAVEQSDLLRKLVEKDVIHGYALPLPLKKITRIPGALMAPMNIQQQNTIDELGTIVKKDRLTHDQVLSGTRVPHSTVVSTRILYNLACLETVSIVYQIGLLQRGISILMQ